MLDLGSKPFYLDEEAERWVISTRLSMSEEDKLRQLFCLITIMTMMNTVAISALSFAQAGLCAER